MDLKPIKPIYLAIIAAVIIGVVASLIWIGFVLPAASGGANHGVSQSLEVVYLGKITSEVIDDERQEHLDAFIEHNAGVKDACEIMHFYSSSCGACQYLAPWLQEFRERYPEVLITSYEIHEADSRTQLESAKEEYGMDAPFIPVVFICGSILEGVEPIKDLLEPMALAVYDLPIRSAT
jgi:thiol-disulfide isomerase/thioredoxin